MAYLEVSVEGMLWKMVTTSTTKSINATLTAVKAFVYDPQDLGLAASAFHTSLSSTRLSSVAPTHVPIPEGQQILFISGPESVNKK